MRFPSRRQGMNNIYNQCVTPPRAHSQTEDEKLHEVAQIEQPRHLVAASPLSGQLARGIADRAAWLKFRKHLL